MARRALRGKAGYVNFSKEWPPRALDDARREAADAIIIVADVARRLFRYRLPSLAQLPSRSPGNTVMRPAIEMAVGS